MENLKELHTQTLKNKQAGIRNTIKMLGDKPDTADIRVALTKQSNEISFELFNRLQAGTY